MGMSSTIYNVEGYDGRSCEYVFKRTWGSGGRLCLVAFPQRFPPGFL